MGVLRLPIIHSSMKFISLLNNTARKQGSRKFELVLEKETAFVLLDKITRLFYFSINEPLKVRYLFEK